MKTTAKVNRKTTVKSPAPATPVTDLLDMEQAIGMLKTSQPTFYRWVKTGKIKGTKVGRQWRFRREELERFLKGEAQTVTLPVSIQPLVDALAEFAHKAGVTLPKHTDENEVLNVVSAILFIAHAIRASDIHFIPTNQTAGTPVVQLRIRVDGTLQTAATFDIRLLPAVVERLKIMTTCSVHETRKPQDGRIQVKLAGETVDIRVSFMPAILGEAVTLRILNQKVASLTLDQLQLPDSIQGKVAKALEATHGVVITSGPTGSGKTTLLYACLMRVARPEKKVITIEDPVEYLLPNVQHTRIAPAEGVTFTTALRSTLRSDPDVIMVGELRDTESLRIIQQAALTGHLVLTTLHASDAVGALRRMLDLGSEPFLIGDTTNLIVSQRLIRKLCVHCARPASPAPDLLAQAKTVIRQDGMDDKSLGSSFHEPVGCPKCNGTGFRGRTAVIEALAMSPEIAAAIRQHAAPEAIRAIAIRQGMVPMAVMGIQLAATGGVSLNEVLAMTT